VIRTMLVAREHQRVVLGIQSEPDTPPAGWLKVPQALQNCSRPRWSFKA
jgi:hypothetical protein